MAEMLLPAMLLFGLIAGAIMAWLVAKSRGAAIAEAAVGKAEAAAQGELVQLRERVRAADEIRRETHERLAQAEREADSIRGELEGAQREVATLTERASRVSTLELELQRAEQMARDTAVEAARLGRESGENAKAVGLLTETVSELRREKDDLEHKLGATDAALNESNERKAALEEQTLQLAPLRQELTTFSRQLVDAQAALNAANERRARLEEQVLQIAPLQASLAATIQQLDAAEKELNDLRESSAGEIARLTYCATPARTQRDQCHGRRLFPRQKTAPLGRHPMKGNQHIARGLAAGRQPAPSWPSSYADRPVVGAAIQGKLKTDCGTPLNLARCPEAPSTEKKHGRLWIFETRAIGRWFL
ncbi:hypothetical protein LJR175_007341 [Variovorax sp. LjRoot175]|uniref:hypothetical protein n=1 Tax=Variovorax sp. LjRoot175 TaxID=3342276 RepID=UPI003ED14258